jgi:uncharacterized protein YkwD
MKTLMLFLLLLPLIASEQGDKYLEKIPAYSIDSYFKQQVYTDKDWKAFYKMDEPQKKVDPQHYDLHLLNAAFFYASNKLRSDKKLPPLEFAGGLRDAALVHTNEMITRNFFDHYNKKDRKLYAPDQRMKLFINQPTFSAENCDENFVADNESITYIQLAERVVKHLYDSPPHRANLLSKQVKYMGCAIMFDAPKPKLNATYLKATQDFTSNI